MTDVKSYDQQLRNIGQSLEAQRINVFKLERHGEHYVVTGEPEKETSLLAALREWPKRWRSEGAARSLSYGAQDVEQLDRQGRAKRSRPDRLPDFYDLSNVLRTVGSHLDSEKAELMELHKSPLNVSLVYRNKDGHPRIEERSIASFYQAFVALHGKRRKSVVGPQR